MGSETTKGENRGETTWREMTWGEISWGRNDVTLSTVNILGVSKRVSFREFICYFHFRGADYKILGFFLSSFLL